MINSKPQRDTKGMKKGCYNNNNGVESSNNKPVLYPTTTTTTATIHSHPMKTRDLPNLSECQACAFRLDTCSTGKSTLQLLYSEWRIVLLCHKCLSRVESSQICSYCFDPIAHHDFFTCSHCNRSVHTNCIRVYKSVAPWSYVPSSSSQFTCCVDCWLPKSIVRKRAHLGTRRSSSSSNGSQELCNSNSFGRNCVLALEATRDRDKRVLVLKKKGLGSRSLGQAGVFDGVEFAYRGVNGGVADSSSSSVLKIKEGNDGSAVGGRLGWRDYSVSVGIEVCDKPDENPSVCAGNENMVMVPCNEGEQSCVDMLKLSGDGNGMNLNCISCEINDGKSDCYRLKYSKRSSNANGVSNDKSKPFSEKVSCQGETSVGRFLFKYRKRKLSSQGNLYSNAETLYRRFFCQRDESTTRYLLKYKRRKIGAEVVSSDKSKAGAVVVSSDKSKVPCEGFLHQNHDLATELASSNLDECKTPSTDLHQLEFSPQNSTIHQLESFPPRSSTPIMVYQVRCCFFDLSCIVCYFQL